MMSQWGLTGWWPGPGVYRAPGGSATLPGTGRRLPVAGCWSTVAVLLSTNLQGVIARSKMLLATKSSD